MLQRALTLGHSPDPDDAFMFYGLAKELIPTRGLRFQHILQDIQTLNERATRGELDVSAISIHAYAHVSDQYALLPSGASMGDGYGPMLVAKEKLSREEIARKKIAVPGTMTSAFLALQLWLDDALPRNPKTQSPSSREPSSSKCQSRQGRNAGLCGPACSAQPHSGGSSANGFRDLDIGISLELGAWVLQLGGQARYLSASRNPKPWFLQE